MKIQKLAFATVFALGASTIALAQSQSGQSGQSGQSNPQRSSQSSSQQMPRGGDRTEQVSFEHADKNADGRVSREEANDIDGFDFSRADTNNDASLTRQEFQTAMATSTPRGDSRDRSESGSGSQSRSASMSFDSVDKNNDGKVSRDEASDIRLNFSAADVDGDSELSRQEFQTAMAGSQPRG